MYIDISNEIKIQHINLPNPTHNNHHNSLKLHIQMAPISHGYLTNPKNAIRPEYNIRLVFPTHNYDHRPNNRIRIVYIDDGAQPSQKERFCYACFYYF